VNIRHYPKLVKDWMKGYQTGFSGEKQPVFQPGCGGAGYSAPPKTGID
jgi:hypothetical protein